MTDSSEIISQSAVIEWLADDPQQVARRQTEQARAELGANDPVMRELIDANPNFDYHAWRATLPVQGLFEALLFQIAAQQISVAAGNAIYGRLRGLFPGSILNPERIAQLSTDDLRGIGFSTRKAEYIWDLARQAAAGAFDRIADLPVEEARKRLISVRGIGPWTADGALLIAFGWADLLVSGDLVLRKAVQQAYNLPELPSEKEVEAIGEQWRPHRSMAAGYLFILMTPSSSVN